MAIPLLLCCLILSRSRTVALDGHVHGVRVHKVPCKYQQADEARSPAPFCLAVSSTMDLPREVNFLATQVWPSARVAARCLLESSSLSPDWSVCELGCGPGLPALSAAAICRSVTATDLDPFCLKLVEEAARLQGVSSKIQTKVVDLTSTDYNLVPEVDLYVLSDVFENSAIAEGTAALVHHLISERKKRVWVFAQSDRSQREVFIHRLQDVLSNCDLRWSPIEHLENDKRLQLINVEEELVNYD